MADDIMPSLESQENFQTARRDFISLWGQMAEHWGINRTMAQIHALLMVSPEPLSAEQVMAQLRISRGNVSMNLRELINWGIVRRISIPGDRRDFFSSEDDVWIIFFQIIRERKKRELDPLLSRLNQCAEQGRRNARAGPDQPAVDAFCNRLTDLRDFFQTVHRLVEALVGNEPRHLAAAVQQMDSLLKESRP